MHLRRRCEQSLEIVRIGGQHHGGRAIRDRRRGDQRIDAVVQAGEEAQPAGATRGQLAGRLEHGDGALQAGKYET